MQEHSMIQLQHVEEGKMNKWIYTGILKASVDPVFCLTQ